MNEEPENATSIPPGRPVGRWEDLRKRIVSAVVLVAVGGAEIWLGGPSFAGHPGLSGWFSRLGERPAFALAAAEIAEADRRLSVPVAIR